MKVLMLSTDRLIFVPGSEVRDRLAQLSQAFDSLTIIVFSKAKLGHKAFVLTPTTLVIPTNSSWRLNYFFDAIRIGKKLPHPDLVTAQDPFETGWVGLKLAQFYHTKLQLQIHTDFLSPYFRKLSLTNRFRVLMAKRLLPKADLIRVVSQRIADSLMATGWKLKTQASVEPVVVNLDKLKSSPVKIDLHQKYPQFSKVILIASRLTREKNITLALEAMRELVKEIPSVGLVIVGSGPEAEDLKNLVQKYNLGSAVIFEPWSDDLGSYYKTADLFLNTSYYEGYGRTFVEAKACGLPVVSTDVGVARESGAIIVNDQNIVEVLIGQLKTNQ